MSPLAGPAAPPPGGERVGLFDSARRLLARLLALAQTRIELLTTELSLELQRAATLLVWAFVALFFGGLAVLMLTLTLVIAFWDDHRLLAAGLATGLFITVTAVAIGVLRHKVRSRGRLLAASLDELSRDVAALDPDKERGR
ncbi:MAG: phage holin family protein [Steroidobacteraceae bacterium]